MMESPRRSPDEQDESAAPGEAKVDAEYKESAGEYSSTIRFDQLDERSFAEFKERVRQHKGLARVFIHPAGLLGAKEFEDRTFETDTGPAPLTFKPLYMLKKVAEKESAPPMIIFENDDRLDPLRRVIEERLGHIPHPLYVLPTLKNYPYPKLSDREEPQKDAKGDIIMSDYSYEYSVHGMVRFVAFLREAGVKKVLVGGTELVVGEDMEHCVGLFVNYFKNISEAEIKISSGTIPHGRKELRRAGFDELL